MAEFRETWNVLWNTVFLFMHIQITCCIDTSSSYILEIFSYTSDQQILFYVLKYANISKVGWSFDPNEADIVQFISVGQEPASSFYSNPQS